MTVKKSRLEYITDYIISSFIYSVIIWIYNAALGWVIYPDSSFDGGLLYGPYSPFLALCVMAVMLIFNLIKKYGKARDINPTPVLLILMSVVLFGVLEHSGSLLYELIYGEKAWDYSGRIFNINGNMLGKHIISVGF